LFNAEAAQLWGGKKVGIKLITEWANKPGDAPDDEYYRGTCNITAADGGANVLTANSRPWYAQTRHFYPAVRMNSGGDHAYRMHGQIMLLDAQGGEIGKLAETMFRDTALVILSRDAPETLLQSLACSLQAQTTLQYLLLETVKMIPAYGTGVDYLTTATSLICGIMREDYEMTFLDLGAWLGGKYLDHLLSPGVFERLSDRQQRAVRTAKEAYDRLDKEKKKREIRELYQKDKARAASTPTQPAAPPPATGTPNKPEKDIADAVQNEIKKALPKGLGDLFKKR
jgi:hypothetical protein